MTPPPGRSLQSVQADWVMPGSRPPAGAQAQQLCAASIWIGLDGDGGSNDVLQAGCDVDVRLQDGQIQQVFRPWWEWYPSGSFWIDNLPVSAGDRLSCTIVLITGSNTEATIVLKNMTSNDTLTFDALAPQGTQLAGNCAEWIVEAVATEALANFGSVAFESCKAGDSSGLAVSLAAAQPITMADGAGDATATSEILGTSGVSVTYSGA